MLTAPLSYAKFLDISKIKVAKAVVVVVAVTAGALVAVEVIITPQEVVVTSCQAHPVSYPNQTTPSSNNTPHISNR